MTSILIALKNGIEYIDESVTSVIEQTYKDWELIIGVNSLEQNSIEYRVAKEYEDIDPRIRVYDMYEVTGKANSLNKMLDYCKYDWVSILDVDDIWMPTKLEKQAPFLNDYDVIGTHCVYFERLEGITPKIPFGNLNDFDFKSVNPIINSSAILRKSLAYWNEEYSGVEDYDLWLRLRRQKKRFYNIEEVLVKHRVHETSAFNSKNQQEKINKILQD